MKSSFLKYLSLAIFLVALSCSGPTERKVDHFLGLKKDTSIKYAKRFSISRNKDFTLIYLFGNKENFDTTATYFIYTDSSLINNVPENITLIKKPCKTIAALSSIYATLFYEMGLLNDIVAIDNLDYVNNKDIIDRVNSKQIKELSKGTEPDLEKTIALNPDIIFTFGMGDPKKDVNTKLSQTKIPVAISLDHKEETPLARAEWIKFFAAFVDKENLADSIFKTVEKNYTQLTAIAQKAETKPSVFNDIKYSDVWYMPGGRSYMAQLLNDAHADYLWKEDMQFGSIPLSFEQVYTKAKKAQFWINVSNLKTKKDLLSFDSRYAEFEAFKNDKVFNNTKFTNSRGYSTYWETGMIYPDRILSDLILIFHPELKTQIKNDLYYYEKLN